MRVLVTGATGMLGTVLVDALSSEYDVFSTGSSPSKGENHRYMAFNLLNDDYAGLTAWANPDVIVHCAAITDGKYCAEHPEEAFKVNGFSVQKLLDASSKEVKIIYISTDAVFSNETHMSDEKEKVAPASVYGKSKELGESILLNSERDYTIIRTTIVGLNEASKKHGFVDWIIASSQEETAISLFDDVLFNPISIWDLSIEISHIISKKRLSSKILHIASKAPCSKYDFGTSLLRELGLSVEKIKRGSIQQFEGRLNRSSDQTLDCSFYQKEYERELPSVKETIVSIKRKYNESN
jgi:dTDP-4-dehydrorhamnose reductase